MDDFVITEEVKTKLRERQGELVTLIEAYIGLNQSKEWNTIKELVFNKSLVSIERQLLNEALNPKVNIEKMYKLQGEWVWAKQFCEPDVLIEALKKQLEDIKNKLK